ncbi:hypothetical protein [Nocardioides piscis]|uniref:NYN domain-containing protein n=1 Tax=Nocardioides piscis TaxID=2714938 RepID=A0A6G7YD53_9ACTN|nr:hypothetical protein [Nocardioides piscis]QIK74752.1 hypothetical protein G7071_04240 [Nocardioides piscis]
MVQTALLWDFDNVIVGKAHLRELASTLGALVDSGAPRIAAAHRHRYLAYRLLLSEHGFEVLSGGRRASGADRELLKRGRHLLGLGTRRFVVASNDGRFSALAPPGELQVVTMDPRQVSRRLARAAIDVRVLHIPNVGNRPEG